MPRKSSAAKRLWLERQVAAGRFASIERAMEYCVDHARRPDAAHAEFDAKITDGDAGPFEPVDAK